MNPVAAQDSQFPTHGRATEASGDNSCGRVSRKRRRAYRSTAGEWFAHSCSNRSTDA